MVTPSERRTMPEYDIDEFIYGNQSVPSGRNQQLFNHVGTAGSGQVITD